MTKVHIGFCAGGSVLTKFMVSVLALMRHDFTHRQLTGGDFTAEEGLYIDNNRDSLARSFLTKTDAEWLLSLDTDVSFGPDVLDLLIDVADSIQRPIVSALYVGRLGPDKQVVPIWLVEGNREKHGYPYQTAGQLHLDRPQELWAVGMGCCLIHRSVLETMQAKYLAGQVSWTASPWVWFGRDAVQTVRGLEPMGEDVCFCARARECGFTVWGHAGVQVTHHKLEGMDYNYLMDAELVRQAKAAVAAEQKQAA